MSKTQNEHLTNCKNFVIAMKALKDIAEFGKKHSGYGYTCSIKAQEALDRINS